MNFGLFCLEFLVPIANYRKHKIQEMSVKNCPPHPEAIEYSSRSSVFFFTFCLEKFEQRIVLFDESSHCRVERQPSYFYTFFELSFRDVV